MLIIGVDEAGRGPLVGSVVAAAVAFPPGFKIDGLTDSKKLSEKKREALYNQITSECYWSIAQSNSKVIDKINILESTMLAMKRAVEKLSIKPELVLIDGNFAPSGLVNFKTIINGDEKVKSISAASIIAKVYRDQLMIKLSEKFQNYAWEKNFGYGTKAHIKGLKKFGVTSHHRKGFKPIHKMLSS